MKVWQENLLAWKQDKIADPAEEENGNILLALKAFLKAPVVFGDEPAFHLLAAWALPVDFWALTYTPKKSLRDKIQARPLPKDGPF